MHNLLFCVHTLCMNYETTTLLLVSSSVRSKQLLCFVHGQGQKSEQKHTTKSFDEFHNHFPSINYGENQSKCKNCLPYYMQRNVLFKLTSCLSLVLVVPIGRMSLPLSRIFLSYHRNIIFLLVFRGATNGEI